MNKDNWFMSPNEWQFIDPTNGFIFPWMVLDFLEHLITFDISEWRIFESGSGAGTLWWADKCKEVVTLETKKDWIDRIRNFAKKKNLNNISYNLVEPDQYQNPIEIYLDVLIKQQQEFDAVIIDGIFRNQLATISECHIKNNGLLIVDNYLQKDVEPVMAHSTVLNAKYPIKIFKQSSISNPEKHPWIWEGNKMHFNKLRQGHPHWKTAYWKIER